MEKRLRKIVGNRAIPRIRHGSRHNVDTLINEEAYLLAKYLRNELETWSKYSEPRIMEQARETIGIFFELLFG